MGARYGKSSVAWGTLFPNITILVVIGTSFFFSIGIEWTLETFMLRCYLSSWLLNHDFCHLPVLSTLQVSVPTTCYNGYRRIILPPRRTSMCLLGCTTDLFVLYSFCRRTVKAVKGALMVVLIVITVSKILFQKRPTTN